MYLRGWYGIAASEWPRLAQAGHEDRVAVGHQGPGRAACHPLRPLRPGSPGQPAIKVTAVYDYRCRWRTPLRAAGRPHASPRLATLPSPWRPMAGPRCSGAAVFGRAHGRLGHALPRWLLSACVNEKRTYIRAWKKGKGLLRYSIGHTCLSPARRKRILPCCTRTRRICFCIYVGGRAAPHRASPPRARKLFIRFWRAVHGRAVHPAPRGPGCAWLGPAGSGWAEFGALIR